MSTTDTRTSDVDTTLREKFYKWYSDQWVANEGVYPDRTEIADFFIGHFHQLLNEKREAIEGMRKNIDYTDTRVTALDRNKYYRLKGYEQGRNKTIDDVLSILKD